MDDRFEHHWIHGHPWGHESVWWPGALLSTFSTLFLVALFIGLAWALLRWVLPYILPIAGDMFGRPPAGPAALEILRERYAAGEIDAVTFEQMRERLEASYRQDSYGIPRNEKVYPHETWFGSKDTHSPPRQGSARMAEQEQYPSDGER